MLLPIRSLKTKWKCMCNRFQMYRPAAAISVIAVVSKQFLPSRMLLTNMLFVAALLVKSCILHSNKNVKTFKSPVRAFFFYLGHHFVYDVALDIRRYTKVLVSRKSTQFHCYLPQSQNLAMLCQNDNDGISCLQETKMRR